MIKLYTTLCICLLVTIEITNGQVAINTSGTAPNGSAMLDVSSTNKGILIPTLALSNIIAAAPVSSPATGLLIWNSNAAATGGTGIGFYYWDGLVWQSILTNTKGWKLTGNSGTNPGTHFIGTTDNQPLILRANNLIAGKVDDNLHNVFLGIKAGLNTSPSPALDAMYNTFVGDSAGLSNTTGGFNSFFGKEAGFANTTAIANSFYGYQAGRGNTTGQPNSFFGYQSGFSNTTGFLNSFYGYSSGVFFSTGSENSFFGTSAGRGTVNVATGNLNSAFGRMAGANISNGNDNSFYGDHAGYNNTSGNQNTFLGDSTGLANTTGNQNSLVGYLSNTSGNFTNATAIGSRAQVSADNTLVLGSINGVNSAIVDTKVGIGVSAPAYKLHVVNNKSNDGGFADGIVVENTNAAVGEAAISFKNVATGDSLWTVGLNQNSNLAFSIGTSFAGSKTKMVIDNTGQVGIGTILPTEKLDVVGNIKASGDVYVTGKVNRPSTGAANMVPICYGMVFNGSPLSGSGNFTVSNSAIGVYNITISGETYNYTTYTATVNACAAISLTAVTLSGAGNLIIRIFDTNGAPINSAFSFVVYKQ